MRPDRSERLKLQRAADFRRRADFAPDKVYRHRGRGWEYIPIHPFADEPADLARLKLRPEDCLLVDAWWSIDGDATLLQSGTSSVHSHPAGLFAKPTPHKEQWVYVVAFFDAPYVTRTAFEEAMTKFAAAGFPSDPRFRLRPGDPWVQI